MVDSWNSAVLNDLIRKQKNIPDLLDKVETDEWNLIRLPYFRSSGYLYRGITSTYDHTGEITLNGTATGGNSNLNIKTVAMGYMLPIGKTYLVSGCPSGGSSDTYYLTYSCLDSGGNTLASVVDYGSGGYLTVPSGTASITVVFMVKSGVTVINLKVNPTIRVFDIPACSETTAGNYSLKATVDSAGAITYSWEEIT